jgi:hypothetical protein
VVLRGQPRSGLMAAGDRARTTRRFGVPGRAGVPGSSSEDIDSGHTVVSLGAHLGHGPPDHSGH